MGRRHKPKSKAGAEGAPEGNQQQQQPDYVQPVDPPRAALAVHPEAGVAVACGLELRVFDPRTQQHKVLIKKLTETPAQQQQGFKATPPYVRGVAFDAAGRYLLAGSEDKAAGLCVWDCSTWELIQTIKVPKKVTSTVFTPGGSHVLAADKFGDVLAAATQRPTGLPEGQQQEPEILLGHYCAILTSLALSSGGRLLATTDRDQRARVSVMPADPLAGAHEIQSFCLGHTAFVTCSTFIKQGAQELLVTGGGDGTLRLWDPLNGELLHTLQLPPLQLSGGTEEGAQPKRAADDAGSSSDDENVAEEGKASTDGGAEDAEAEEGGGPEAACATSTDDPPDDAPVPLALAASPDGSWLVAAVDGRDELCLLRLDWAGNQLQECGWFALHGLHLPTCLAFDGSGRLWAAGGPVADDSQAAFLACASIAPPAAGGDGMQQEQGRLVAAPLPTWLPATAAQELEAKVGNEVALLADAAEQRRLASQLLRKRRYSLKQLEHRKCQRKDKMLAAAVAQEQVKQQQD